MEIQTIMTGSDGNCSLISYKNTNILIDGGFSTKKMMEEVINEQLYNIHIDAILITHEHTDHFSQWTGRLSMEYNIPIYLSKRHYENEEKRKTKYLSYFNKRKNIFYEAKIVEVEENTTIEIKDLKIKILNVYHDANKTFGFVINDTFGYITDCGFVSSKIKKEMLNVTSIALEANYDSSQLMNSDRNWQNKLRTIGKFGHLDNLEALKFIKYLIKNGKLKQVFTLHPSEKHNSLEILQKNFQEIKDKIEIHFLQRTNNPRIKIIESE